jgi:hypothetical protein
VRVTPTSGLGTTEAGGAAEFTVELTEAPTADVVILAHVSDASEGRLEQSRLVFTPADFGPRTVRVAGVDDPGQDGNQTYQVILDEAVSADLRYQSVQPADVTITNVDDDVVGVTVLAAEAMTLGEGQTQTFTVQLNSQPSGAVVVQLGSSDAAEATLSVQELHFYPRAWDEVQTVTITGSSEQIDDGDKPIVVTTSRVQTSDIAYLGLDPADVRLTKVDDDTSAFTLGSEVPIVVREGRWPRTEVEIGLASQPSGEVRVSLRSADGHVYSDEARFYPSSWQPQRVSLRADSDGYADGVRPVVLDFSVFWSEDPLYRELRQSVTITLHDSDAAGVGFQVEGATSEEGACFDLLVWPTSRPRADVTARLVSRTPSEVAIRAGEVTFRAGEQYSQTTVVCGVDDELIDGDQVVEVALEIVATADPVYAALPPRFTWVTNRDDDNAPVARSVEALPYTTSQGRSVDIFVKLPAAPTAPVTVPVSSHAPWLGAVGVESLTFTPDNWDVEQVVTVTGQSHWNTETVAYELYLGTATSDDPRFHGAVRSVALEHRFN